MDERPQAEPEAETTAVALPPTAAETDAPAHASTVDVDPSAVVPGRLARAAARPSALRLFTAGWGTAGAWALGSFAAVGLIAEGMAFLASLAGRSGASAGTITRVGGLLFLSFHHVALVLEPPVTNAGFSQFGLVAGLRVTVAATPMLGTAAAIWLLSIGGGAAGARAGGPAWHRGLHGMKVAPLYAAACVGVSFLLDLSVRVPAGAALGIGSQAVALHPARPAAFAWPLILGLVAGFAGGVRSAGRAGTADGVETAGSDGEGGVFDRRLLGAVGGGIRMLVLALGLSFAGLLVLGAANPHLTRAYVSGMFAAGVERGLTLLAFNVLLIPNMAAWALFPSMGACFGGSASFAASVGRGSVSRCLLSYTTFPPRGGLRGLQLLATSAHPASLLPPPAGYFLFVVAPLVAVVLGGRHAAGRARTRSLGEASGVGAAAGALFGGLALLVGVASELGLRIGAASSGATGALGSGRLRVGPYVLLGAAIALGWGVVGGATGGMLARRTPPTTAESWDLATGEPMIAGPRASIQADAPGLPAGPDAPGF